MNKDPNFFLNELGFFRLRWISPITKVRNSTNDESDANEGIALFYFIYNYMLPAFSLLILL